MLGAQNGENDIDHGENELGIVGVFVLVFEWPKVLGFEGLFGMTFEEGRLRMMCKCKESETRNWWFPEKFSPQPSTREQRRR